MDYNDNNRPLTDRRRLLANTLLIYSLSFSKILPNNNDNNENDMLLTNSLSDRIIIVLF